MDYGSVSKVAETDAQRAPSALALPLWWANWVGRWPPLCVGPNTGPNPLLSSIRTLWPMLRVTGFILLAPLIGPTSEDLFASLHGLLENWPFLGDVR